MKGSGVSWSLRTVLGCLYPQYLSSFWEGVRWNAITDGMICPETATDVHVYALSDVAIIARAASNSTEEETIKNALATLFQLLFVLSLSEVI